MKSYKKQILEAYSEDMKKMYLENHTTDAPVDVKKWVEGSPKHKAKFTNIVDAYANICDQDNYRKDKIDNLYKELLSEKSETLDESEGIKMPPTASTHSATDSVDGGEVEKNGKEAELTSTVKEETWKKGYLEGYNRAIRSAQGLDETEGLKPAPASSKHPATNSVDGGDVTDQGKKAPLTSTIDGKDDDAGESVKSIAMKEFFDSLYDSLGFDEMNRKIHEKKDEEDEKVEEGEKGVNPFAKDKDKDKDLDEAGSSDYQKFFKKKLGDKDINTMSDDEKKKFFDMIDKEWNSEGESGKDGAS